MMERKKQRDLKIEFIRVVACFLVILNHIMIVPTSGDGVFYDGTALLVAIIWTDVPLFLIISGFVLFQQMGQQQLEEIWPTYWHRIKRFATYVFIPSCIVVLICTFFYPAIVDGTSVLDVIRTRDFHLEYIKNYIFLQMSSSIYSIFWYIWTYAKVILFFPFFAFVCQDTKDKNILRRFIMLLSGLNILFLDVQGMVNKEIGNFDSVTFDRYFLYIFIGYELYLMTQKLDRKKMQWGGLGVFLLSILGTVLLQHIHFYRYEAGYLPYCLVVTSSAALFLFLYATVKPKQEKLWGMLGKVTLYIYLVHIIVINICSNIWGDFFWKLCGSGSNTLYLILFDLLYGAIIFAIAFIVAVVFQTVYEKGIVRLCNLGIRKIKGSKK